MAKDCLGMAFDAIRTLRDMRHRYGDELLYLNWQSAIGEHFLTEHLKGRFRFRRKLAALFGKFSRGGRI
jgi:hypothetical protein